MPERLSTADVEERDRLDYWQYVCGEKIGSFALEDYEPENFSAGFEMSRVGTLEIGHFTGVSQTLHRRQSLIKSGDKDRYIVLLESDRLFNLDHGGRQHSGRNGIVLIDIGQPYYSNHPEGVDVIDVFIPRGEMQRALGPIRHATGLSIGSDQASYPVIAAFLKSLVQYGDALDAASAARMSTIAVDLIASGFAERLEQSPPGQLGAAATLCRAQAYIAEHMSVVGLGMQDIAAALNISVRRLHAVAAAEGVSLIEWMWERRLTTAQAMLAEPANDMMSIASIAYRCGFGDQAHFSRRFKARFGHAPSEARRVNSGRLILS